ncbi:MAG: Mth938-like domain-containing protein [Candidatus Omnitrophica bacterium]|nr:Mth938-like domain-containing protein [Candidatus Omnitrophota bacterium]
MKVDNYAFGSMTVDGKVHNQDLIVFPDTIKPNWWRKEGHSLMEEDIKEIIDYKPDVLIIGKGAYGVMAIPESTRKLLKSNNIELIDRNTPEAYKVFNQYVEKGKKAVGAFHLTC